MLQLPLLSLQTVESAQYGSKQHDYAWKFQIAGASEVFKATANVEKEASPVPNGIFWKPSSSSS